MELKLEVSQKIENDNYVNMWVWRILDENKKEYASGEATTFMESYEIAKSKLKKFTR